MEINAEERKIWWIASYPKSGNTWVRMFLNAYLTGFPLNINSGFQYAIGDNHPGLWQTTICRQVDQLTVAEQALIRPAVLFNALYFSAAKHVCLKTHHAKVKVEDIPLIPVKFSAGGIYIIRDPRDVAISFADHLGDSIDDVINNMGCKQYINTHRISNLAHILTTWSIHVETWVHKNKDLPIKVTRYEDMLENTDYEFRRILEALGLSDINEERFKFALDQTKFENLQKLEDKHGFMEKGQGKRFFRVGKAGQWEDILTQEQIQRIQDNHGEMMEKYGYEKAEVIV